ncbi:MAG: M48 family metalloprotease, partial [Candidatus Omnitrophica bacterium]|nr:M48 family metalloprotease [Candidatus Omnitrophota bacterium]
MSFRTLKTWIVTLGILILSAGCAYINPLIQDVNFISVPEEIQLSEQIAAEMTREMPLRQDPTLNAVVSSIGNRLAAVLPRRDFNYQFYVVQDPTPNAFTIPGGRIYIHRGLLNFVESEDELAG